MSARPFGERIARGREAISRARAQGRDTSEWEAHLQRLAEAERRARLYAFRVEWPAIHDDPEFRDDVIYFVLDSDSARQAPPGAVVYALGELEAIKGLAPATVRLFHVAKRAGGTIVQTDRTLRRPLLEATRDVGARPIEAQRRRKEMAREEGLKNEVSMPEPEPGAAPETKPLPEIPKMPQSVEVEIGAPGQGKERVTIEPLATSEDGTEAIIKVSVPKPSERPEGDATGLALLALIGAGILIAASAKKQPPQPSV